MRIYRLQPGESWDDETASGLVEVVGTGVFLRYGLNPGDDLAAVIQEGFESFPKAVNVYGYPVDAPKYPAIVVTADTPFQEVKSMGPTGNSRTTWRWRVLCCVPRGNPREMWPLLYDLRQHLTSVAFASPGKNSHAVYAWSSADAPEDGDVNAQDSWVQSVAVRTVVDE